MQTMIVNGGKAIEVPIQLQGYLTEVLTDMGTNPQQKHEKICMALRIGRFIPAPQHKPYAIRAVRLQIYDASRCTHSFGGWHECYYCHAVVDLKPTGQNCISCGMGCLPNFKSDSITTKFSRVIGR